MVDIAPTWLVLLRDLSNSVRVPGESQIIAGLVLHAETGLVLGTHLSPTAQTSLAGALQAALTSHAAGPPTRPATVVCPIDIADQLQGCLEATGINTANLVTATSMDDAEDIFDGLEGHLSGRTQPLDPPTSADWLALVQQTHAYCLAEPWTRWSDASHLDLRLTRDTETEDFIAIVMGNAGVQRGLALYSGTRLPPGVGTTGPRGIPPGTLLLFLDPAGEGPPDLQRKAVRYGWSGDSELFPAWVARSPHGPSDLNAPDAHRLHLALAAVLALDAQGPVLATRETVPVHGTVTLTTGHDATFAITRRPT